MAEANPDYTTVFPAPNGKGLAVWMRYRPDLEYYVYQSEGPMRLELARRLAQNWAKLKHLEYRP